MEALGILLKRGSLLFYFNRAYYSIKTLTKKMLYISNIVFAEPLRNWQRGFQTPASPIAEGIFAFHDDLRIFLTAILSFVRYLIAVCLNRFAFSEAAKKGTSHRLVHASVLEVV